MRILLRNIVFAFPWGILICLMALSFFQHPGADDFTVNFFVKTFGLPGAVSQYLTHFSGRYFSVSVLLFIASFRSILDHYYIIPLVFLLATFGNIYFFIKRLNTVLFEKKISGPWRSWMAAFFLLMLLSSMPQPGSFIFWLSAGIGYLMPFNFFLFYLIALYDFSLPQAGGKKGWLAVVVIGLTLILSGSDEISTFFLFVASGSLLGYQLFQTKNNRLRFVLVLTIQLLIIFSVFLFPGNRQRGGGYVVRQPLIYSLGGSLYQTLQVFYYIFSNIFFWIGFASICCAYPFLQTSFRQKLENKKTSVLFECFFLFFAVVLIHAVARHLAGVILPPRTKNLIVAYTMIGLLTIALLNSGSISQLTNNIYEKLFCRQKLFFCVLIILFVFNPFMLNLFQTVMMAPIHLRVLQHRVDEIQQAKAAGSDKVTLSTYGQDFRSALRETYGKKMADFVGAEFPDLSPRLLFVSDDPASKINGLSYDEYYGIDTVIVGKDTSVSWKVSGLDPWGKKK